MGFDPVIASRRFGMGRSPAVKDPRSVAEMMAALTGPDLAAEAFPIPGQSQMQPTVAELREAATVRHDARGTAAEEAAAEAQRMLRDQARAGVIRNAMAVFARAVTTGDGFRERLTAFWADHFTVRARQGLTTHLVTPFITDAIRPHLTGRFADMLTAVVLHPMMLVYLDQARSIGPNSRVGLRRDQGLNENLARELLELHTVGVDGAYTQTDVTQLAELLTGLSIDGEGEFRFRQDIVEPGAETVLGQSYGGKRRGQLDAIREALKDLATHPDTARHIAHKLATHFVADTPPEALVDALSEVWRDSGGDLAAVTGALLNHPDAWQPEARKVLPPQQFIASGLRALAVPPESLFDLDRPDTGRVFLRSMQDMGQPWEQPPGPDGWPEEAVAWITPQGMASRITWAMTAPGRVLPDLPDPRLFAEAALGPNLPEPVRFAASAAETRREGVGLVLASAAFQRR